MMRTKRLTLQQRREIFSTLVQTQDQGTLTVPESRKAIIEHFKISDVHIPDPTRLLHDLYGSHLLQGRVSEISERAGQKFVVVEVEGIPTPLIVSVERILGVL